MALGQIALICEGGGVVVGQPVAERKASWYRLSAFLRFTKASCTSPSSMSLDDKWSRTRTLFGYRSETARIFVSDSSHSCRAV